MPKTARSGAAKQSELPATLQRSDELAQRTYAHAYDAAIEQYDGDEEAAHRVAFAALKHTHEKVGDSWRPKEHNGPSDGAPRRATARRPRLPAASTRTRPRRTCTSLPRSSTSRAGRR